MKNNNLRVLMFYAVLIVGILIAISFIGSDTAGDSKKFSEIVQLFREDKVAEFVINDKNNLTIKTTDNEKVEYKLRNLDQYYQNFKEYVVANLQPNGNLKSYDIKELFILPWWVDFVPYLFIIVVFIVIWVMFINQATGKGGKITSFGKARTKLGAEEKKKIYFADLAGIDEEKEELREVVDYLRNPLKYIELGAHIPRGVLLVGPPGTGKTRIAKAVAGEANVPFYSISGSDFVEMYVGVGASRVRDLFETAKKNPASIVFIDEIDAVGRHRGAGLGGSHDEREQTLNQLLVEMDGFGTNEGVIVIAATNRPDILDPALLRPGRFDRQITMNYPDIKGREEILKIHARGKPFEQEVRFDDIAKTTVGFTGADLENLLNEGALIAARKQKKLIGMNDLEEAMIKIMVGPQKKSKVISEKERKLTAYHEAGHAITTRELPTQDPVLQISIIPAGRAGGYTLAPPKEDKYYMSRQEMEEELVSLLGGRVAEKMVLDDISTGASNDIQRVSSLARKMITQYGMSDKLGPIVFGTGHDEVFLGKEFSSSRNYSEKIASDIDDEVKALVDAAYAKAEKILKDKLQKLHFTAEYLFNHEVMDGVQFEAIMDGEPTVEELEAMVSEKKRRSDEENLRARRLEEERVREDQLRREELFKKEHEERLREARERAKKEGGGKPPDGPAGGGDISFKDGGNL